MTDTTTPARHDTCGARARTGKPCGRPAGWGTSHPGIGSCKLHGGSTPSGEKSASRKLAARAVVTYGGPVDVDPHAALLDLVHRTAGHVAWLGHIVAELSRDDVVKGQPTIQFLPNGDRRTVISAGTNVWVELYQKERDLLRKISADAVRAGVEERRVELVQGQAERLVRAVQMTVELLGHDPSAPDVRKAISRGLLETSDDEGEPR